MAGRSRSGRRQRPCLLEFLEGRRLLAAQFYVDLYPEGDGPDFVGPIVEGRTLRFMNTGSLWRTDGYAGTTLELQPIAGRRLVPGDMAGTQQLLLFAGNLDGDDNWELWRSNALVEGTTLVKEIRPGTSAGSNPVALTALGESILFAADDGAHGYELWRTDGTAEGTQLVKDIRPGPADGTIRPSDVAGTRPRLHRVGDVIYFGADAEGDGMDLWKTDGTAAGTMLVKSGVDPREMVELNGAVVVRDFDGSLWRSDGSEAGTVELAPPGGKQFELLTSAGDSVFF